MQKLHYFIVHFFFWTTFVALSWMSISASPDELMFLSTQPLAPLILLLWGAVNFYSFYFYFQPLYLDKGKYIRYLIAIVIFIPVVSAFFIGIFWLLFPVFREYALQKLLESIAGSFLISQCGSLLRGYISWHQNLQNKTVLENQSLRNELAMLKAQLSPHFLFNTLNNIDTLIYQSQDQASAMLIKLAALLRYMLYESDGKEVPISKEIEYIQQLTDLQRLRFEKSDYIELTIENDAKDLKIAPLIFLPFIENAYKFVSKPEQMPAITIHLKTTDQEVNLSCQNYFAAKAQIDEEEHHGIGLANARRRLELLYPNTFDLQVSKGENIFEVNLSIQIA